VNIREIRVFGFVPAPNCLPQKNCHFGQRNSLDSFSRCRILRALTPYNAFNPDPVGIIVGQSVKARVVTE
jgi:hypothetical protein